MRRALALLALAAAVTACSGSGDASTETSPATSRVSGPVTAAAPSSTGGSATAAAPVTVPSPSTSTAASSTPASVPPATSTSAPGPSTSAGPVTTVTATDALDDYLTAYDDFLDEVQGVYEDQPTGTDLTDAASTVNADLVALSDTLPTGLPPAVEELALRSLGAAAAFAQPIVDIDIAGSGDLTDDRRAAFQPVATQARDALATAAASGGPVRNIAPDGPEAAVHAARAFLAIEPLAHPAGEKPGAFSPPQVRFYAPFDGPVASDKAIETCRQRLGGSPPPVEGGLAPGIGGCALAAFVPGTTDGFQQAANQWFSAPSATTKLPYLAAIYDSGTWQIVPSWS